MDRLTFDGNFCDISMCREPYPCKYHDTGCSQKQVWERLKAYEDTGMTPEQIQNMRWRDAATESPTEDGEVITEYGFVSGGKIGYLRFYEVLPYYATAPNPHFHFEDGDMGLKVTRWMPLTIEPEVKKNG